MNVHSLRSVALISILFFCANNFLLSDGRLYYGNPKDPLPGIRAPVGSLWPRAVEQESLPNIFSVDTDIFKIDLFRQNDGGVDEPMTCPLLDWAVSHYTQLIRNLHGSNDSGTFGGISALRLELVQCPEKFEPDEYEYYELSVKTEMESGVVTALVRADVPLGAIRGLESFYQLLWSPEDDDGDFLPVYVNETMITDWARFGYRGLMLDSARHYLPENLIIDVLTAMMYNKFNVFHWHLVDDQSFPYVSQKFPELSAKGAYQPDDIYTPEAVQRIIKAAMARGIRTIFEFDTPGHAGGFGLSHQELLTPCYGDGVHAGTPDFPNHAAYENLDPSNDQVYDFLRELFSELVANVSVDPLVHLGMDEVYTPCWQSSPIIKAFMLNHGYTRLSQVQEHFTHRHVEMVKSLGVTPVSWQDPLDAGVELDKEVVIHVWKSPWPEAWLEYLERGYKMILSACWYLNKINYGSSWRAYYECDPIRTANVNETMIDQIMGGEACIWGEYVDATNLIPRLFPYASAVAEVLWTDREEKDKTDDAMWRLDQFRCSMLRRGISAQPLFNGHCGPRKRLPANQNWARSVDAPKMATEL